MNAHRTGPRSPRTGQGTPKTAARKVRRPEEPGGELATPVPEIKPAKLALLEPAGQILAKLVALQALATRAKFAEKPRSDKRESLRTGVPQKFLDAFDNLVRHGRTAVALLSATGACGGCHLMVPAGLAAHIHCALDQLHFCPHCGCVLYVAESLALTPEQVPGTAPVRSPCASARPTQPRHT